MKTRSRLTLLSLILFCSNQLFAADRVVQQNGPAGTYASITAAITASVDGDNIVVNNRTDGLPWLENITINKSLTFVSAVDNIQWWMEGTISITMAEGRTITMVGMRNTGASGDITKTGTNPVNRTVLNILYSDVAGDITMVSGINLYLGSSKASDVTFSYGKIIGNDLRSLVISPDAVTTEDVNQVIGNRIGYWTAPTNTAFTSSSATQYLFFSNNYVRSTTYAGSIASLKTGVTTNRIINSVFASSYSGFSSNGVAALSITHTSGQLSLENSVLCGHASGSNGSVAITISTAAAALTTCTYNMYWNQFGYGTALSTSLNNFSVPNFLQSYITSDGAINTFTSYVDAGNPSNAALDLDLSRNDVGVFGGSYSMTNFMPLMANGESSRVNYMNTPRIVNQGGTINVQVIGYDK